MRRIGVAAAVALASVAVAPVPAPATTLGDLVAKASTLFGEPCLLASSERRGEVRFDPADFARPRAEFTAAFEAALHAAGFVDVERHVGRARTHEIVRLEDDRERNHELETARHLVGLAELESLSERWSYVTTIVICHGIPPREVKEVLGKLCDARIREDVRVLDGTDALVLTGFAKDLAALGPKFAELGAEVVTPDDSGLEAAAPPAVPAQNRPRLVLTGSGEERPLSTMIADLSRLLDEPIFDSPDGLAHESIAFDGTIEIDRDSALEWLDLLLARCHLLRLSHQIGAQRYHQVVSERFASRSRDSARWISEEEIASSAGEVVATTFRVRGTNAREYVTTLNKHCTGDAVGAMRNVEGTNLCTVVGPADGVGFVLRLARELERHASSR